MLRFVDMQQHLRQQHLVLPVLLFDEPLHDWLILALPEVPFESRKTSFVLLVVYFEVYALRYRYILEKNHRLVPPKKLAPYQQHRLHRWPQHHEQSWL